MNDATAITVQQRFDLVPVDPGLLPVRLVCGPQLIVGRNKDECDLVSWFIPRSAENDQETKRLSQVHCFLEHESSFVRVRDADSAAGTRWNQLPVPLGEGQCGHVGPHGRLTLGKHYHINVEWMPESVAVCAVLTPVCGVAIRHCVWMIASRCGFRAGDGTWLVPAQDGGDAQVLVEARGRELWWRAARGEAQRLVDGVEVMIGGVRVQVVGR